MLSVARDAPADEIKKAFRVEIARYHPDKVQHLGEEFQEMAATRAAQLTEAYRTLMSPDLRAAYDQQHAADIKIAAASTSNSPQPAAEAPHAPPRPAQPERPAPKPAPE